MWWWKKCELEGTGCRLKPSVNSVFKWESLSSASTQAATQQDQLSSPAAVLFSVGFFRQRFGNYCPTSTWWIGSGIHSSGKHSFSWHPTTPVGEAAVVTPAWRSMLHTVTHTHSHLLCLLCLSFFASPSLFCPFTTSQAGKWGNGKRKKKTEKRHFSISPSLCLALVCLSPPPSLLLPPCCSQWDVLTLSKRCACSFTIQSAKPIDPLTTRCSTSFRKEHVCTCTISIHTGVHIFTHRASTV